MLLTGHPGTGKTAVVDHLWGSGSKLALPAAAAYYCRADEPATCDPVRFTESLAEQLSVSVPGFAEALKQEVFDPVGRTSQIHLQGSASVQTAHPGASVIGLRVTINAVSPDEALDRLVRRPFERLGLTHRALIVVDALDEAMTYRTSRTLAELVLQQVVRLPVRLFITSRPDERLVETCARLPKSRRVDLIDDAPQNASDLTDYAMYRLRRKVRDLKRRRRLAQQLAREGSGNYLYVYHLTEDIRRGARSLSLVDEVNDFPQGLEELYRQFIEREIRPIGNASGERYWREEIRPLLAVLVAAMEGGFSATQLAEILESTEMAVRDVVRVLGQYLIGGPRGPWRLYHRSFADFLHRGPDPYLDYGEGHRRIARFACAEWRDDWGSCVDSYYLRYLPSHLMLALDSPTVTRAQARVLRDDLYNLARSPAFLDAQRAVAAGVELHLSTIRLAIRSSLAANAYERAAVLGIALIYGRAGADAVSPTQAALSWGVAAGTAKAETYPAQHSLIWHLLMLASFVEHGRSTEVREIVTIIGRDFRRISPEWSVPAAAIVAPIVPLLDEDELRGILQLAGDRMLGYLAFFILEGPHPDWAMVPAVWIIDDGTRARATTEILSRLAYAKDYRQLLPRMASWVTAAYLQGHRRDRKPTRRALARVLKDEIYSEIRESILLAEAAQGNSDKTSEFLQVRIIAALMNGGNDDGQLRHDAEKLLRSRSSDELSCLRCADYLFSQGSTEPAAALLDRVIELTHAERFKAEWEYYGGHEDAFHGPCDVGLRLALIRSLCAQGRLTDALAEAERFRNDAPSELIRALSYLAASDPDTNQPVVAMARQVAADAQTDLDAQAMLVLADGDREAFLTRVAGALGRERTGATAEHLAARAALAWAANRRGDSEPSAALARDVADGYARLPKQRRYTELTTRVVRNLLRAGQPDAAVGVLRAGSEGSAVPRPGSWKTLSIDELLAMDGEIPELRLLLLRPDSPASGHPAAAALLRDPQCRNPDDLLGSPRSTPLAELALLISVARAVGNTTVVSRVEKLLRDRIRNELEVALQETIAVRDGKTTLFSFWPSKVRSAELALRSAEVNDVESCERALYSLSVLGAEAEFAWGFRRAFWGVPRRVYDEHVHEEDTETVRRADFLGLLSNAFQRAGNEAYSTKCYKQALLIADQIKLPLQRSAAFQAMTLTAARCGRYGELRPLWEEAIRVHDAGIAAVAEVLVMAVQRGGEGAPAAREALHEMLMSTGFANLDYLELISMLAVLAPEPGAKIEASVRAAMPNE
ncbi:hypothetical protein ACFP2T_41600 [Plantactinospora solaniradicis]|uniref:NACHT domain-containing protein n=1 Tax=Plantactinospora solaniradicis TaxID=1723736 RepID=A0ABW1KNZ1_9ACTN